MNSRISGFPTRAFAGKRPFLRPEPLREWLGGPEYERGGLSGPKFAEMAGVEVPDLRDLPSQAWQPAASPESAVIFSPSFSFFGVVGGHRGGGWRNPGHRPPPRRRGDGAESSRAGRPRGTVAQGHRNDAMLRFPGSLKVFVCPEPMDKRKGFEGLHAAVEERLGEDVRSGARA